MDRELDDYLREILEGFERLSDKMDGLLDSKREILESIAEIEENLKRRK